MTQSAEQQVAYLDNNSTTVIHPDVVAAMHECHAQGFMNPASQHAEGRRARKALEQARHGIGKILGARLDNSQSDRIILTSGATEANNLALFGTVAMAAAKSAAEPSSVESIPRIIVSDAEHPSVLEAAKQLARPNGGSPGVDLQWLPTRQDGVANIDLLPDLITPQTVLVAMMLGNNETGVLQPVDQAARVCESHGVPLHTDAVQVVGRMPVSFRELNVASMTATAHKVHGPRGVGVLLLRHDQQLAPTTYGGSQQLGTRPGTESVALAVGMWTALRKWRDEQQKRLDHMLALRERFETKLTAKIPNVVIHGASAQRLPHTSNVSFPGLDRQAMLLALDGAGVACSTGSACTSGSSEPSHVLIAMGCPAPMIESALRFSLAATSTAKEVDLAVEKIVGIQAKMSAFFG